MYISQKLIVGMIFLIALIGGGGLWLANMNKPSQQINLSPSPDTSLFSSSTPVPTSAVDPRQQAEQVAQSVLGGQSSPSDQSQLTQPGGQNILGEQNSPTVSRTHMPPPPVYSTDELKNKKAVIVTDKGTIEFEIFDDTPIASSNFIYLANTGFYNGLTFHRVEPGFVIQGGDPLGNGTGGPGYTVKETNIKGNYDTGIVAWAKTSEDPAGTAGSQFFIMMANNQLPADYASFGKVIKGQDVVDKIQVGDVMHSVTIQPLQ